MSDGLLTVAGDMGRDIASMADYFDMKNLDISGEDGDVDVETKYGTGYELKEFGNKGASVATIICQTVHSPDEDVTLKVNVGNRSGKLPKIASITKAGTDDDLVLFFQKRQ